MGASRRAPRETPSVRFCSLVEEVGTCAKAKAEAEVKVEVEVEVETRPRREFAVPSLQFAVAEGRAADSSEVRMTKWQTGRVKRKHVTTCGFASAGAGARAGAATPF